MIKFVAKTLVEDGYDMKNENLTATLFATGNGFLGVRGSFEEYSTLKVQGTYINGILDETLDLCEPVPDNVYMRKWFIDEEGLKRHEYKECCINIADILTARIKIGSNTFFPWVGKVSEWRRILDPYTAVLTRSLVWQSPDGDETRIEFQRFASFDNIHLYCQKISVTPINHCLPIQIIGGIDLRTKTKGQRVQRIKATQNDGDTMSATVVSGPKHKFEVDIHVRLTSRGVKLTEEKLDGFVLSAAEFETKQDRTITLEKITAVNTDRHGADTAQILKRADGKSYETLKKEHLKAYGEYFAPMDIDIDGDDYADNVLRFSSYHTAISADKQYRMHAIGAKGLTGEQYHQFVWWDCDIYQLPFFLHTQPATARNAIEFRYQTLPYARQNAKDRGYKGARFAFCSGIDGTEQVWAFARHPFMQDHIDADVMYGVIRYFMTTGDLEFLQTRGLEILTSCADYWLSRATLTSRGYEILKVTGPDEHHPYLNNNAYTNYLVKFTVEKTAEYCEKFGGAGFSDSTKIESYRQFAKKVFLPDSPSGLIPQFDGYFDLSRTIESDGGFAGTQMKHAGGQYHKSQIIKQPDVLLLYSYVDAGADKKQFALNFDYYENMCESSSSLSYAPHAICAAQNDRMLSFYKYLIKTCTIDLDNLHGDSAAGIHSGCAAGGYLSVLYGLLGAKFNENTVEINPRHVPWFKSLRLRFVYRGTKIEVAMGEGKTVLKKIEGKDAEIIFDGAKYNLKDTLIF